MNGLSTEDEKNLDEKMILAKIANEIHRWLNEQTRELGPVLKAVGITPSKFKNRFLALVPKAAEIVKEQYNVAKTK